MHAFDLMPERLVPTLVLWPSFSPFSFSHIDFHFHFYRSINCTFHRFRIFSSLRPVRSWNNERLPRFHIARAHALITRIAFGRFEWFVSLAGAGARMCVSVRTPWLLFVPLDRSAPSGEPPVDTHARRETKLLLASRAPRRLFSFHQLSTVDAKSKSLTTDGIRNSLTFFACFASSRINAS